jgi:hypothetical protein
MAESSDDFRSRVQEYKQGLEDLLVDAQVAIDRQAPDLLDKVAATARNVAQHMDELASEARRRAEQREATRDAATPGPASGAESDGAPPEEAATTGGEPSPAAPDEPPRSAGESSTAA